MYRWVELPPAAVDMSRPFRADLIPEDDVWTVSSVAKPNFRHGSRSNAVVSTSGSGTLQSSPSRDSRARVSPHIHHSSVSQQPAPHHHNSPYAAPGGRSSSSPTASPIIVPRSISHSAVVDRSAPASRGGLGSTPPVRGTPPSARSAAITADMVNGRPTPGAATPIRGQSPSKRWDASEKYVGEGLDGDEFLGSPWRPPDRQQVLRLHMSPVLSNFGFSISNGAQATAPARACRHAAGLNYVHEP